MAKHPPEDVRMMGFFVTLSSMFVGNTVLLIVFVASGDVALAMLSLLGAMVTGNGIVHVLIHTDQRLAHENN